ncbi:HD family phosphohydrolase [Clostridia bacterium]|nr:HD family phosphohydrolase [Clostridia bacterium]
MRIDLLLSTISKGLDLVEKDIVGSADNHAKRVAVICGLMGRELGFDDNELTAFSTCALLHDSSLTEWLSLHEENQKGHCVIGQKNVKMLPFKSSIDGFILYHHENADGSGYFGKKSGEYPFKAELIGIADRLDVEYDFSNGLVPLDFKNRFSEKAQNLLEKVLDKYIDELKNENIDTAWQKYIPAWEVPDDETEGVAKFLIKIIDAKSTFTARHSSGIAKKSQIMSDFYHYDKSTKSRLYLAAAIHDLGKLGVPSGILEKPGKLTNEEFILIKNHALLTFQLLDNLDGFSDIKNWASNHHEKLDGTGYPFNKNANQLDFNSRLMACLDIYQAVSEARPYHNARSHDDTMKILFEMARAGYIDAKIAGDMDYALCFAS